MTEVRWKLARKASRPALGFTLLELMIVVGIIGVLASVAIPGFQRLLLRTKESERRYVITTIKRGVEDLYVQNGDLPAPVLFGDPQPPLPATTDKRLPDWAAGDWPQIFHQSSGVRAGAPEIEGTLYYCYTFTATNAGGVHWLSVTATGDLDGDGDPSNQWVQWKRVNGSFVTQDDWQLPVGWVDQGGTDGRF